MVPSDAVELRGSGSYLLIGRRLSFGQLSSRGHRMPGVVGDPHRLADLMRRYLQQSGNEGKLRAFWWRVAGGMNTPWRVQDLIAEVVRYVSAGHWLALEVQEERRGAVSLEQERRQADIRPAVIGPCSGDIGSLSLEEKFSIAFRKVPDHLEEGFRDSFRNLISPAAIGFTVATTVAIAGVSVASGGTAVPVIIAIGYALVGWAIFNAVGELIDTFLLVYNATDERDLDRAATKLASAAAELTVGVLITLLTRGAGRLGVGGKSRVRTNQTNDFETVPPSRERFEAPREVETPRTVRETETSNRTATTEQADNTVSRDVYDNAVSDKGRQSKVIELDERLKNELKVHGVKHTPEDIVAIRKLDDGRIVFIENGNESAGLEHILRHGDDFRKKGISDDMVADFIMKNLDNGKIVGYQGKGKGRPIYELIYNGQKHHTAITTGNNGFVVGANPVSIK